MVESVRKRLTLGAIWTAGGRILSNLMGLASTLALARLLTPNDFGLVAIATVIYAIIGAVTELSLGSALIQHKSLDREHYDTAWTLGILRSVAIALVLVVAAYPVAAVYGDQRLVGIFFLLGVSALVQGLANPKLIDYRRRLSFHQEILSDVATKLVGLAVSVAIALTFHSFWALVIGALASQTAGVIISYVIIPYAPRLALAQWRNLFSFSIWLALSSGLNALNYRADQLALGAMMGNGPLGQYTVGDNLAALPVRESTAPITNVLFPAFSRLQDDPYRLRQAFLRMQRLLVATALPVGMGFALVAGPLINLVLGPQWTQAALVGQILGATYAAQAFLLPVTPLAMGLGRTRLLFVRDVFYVLVRYPLIFVGLFTGGLFGLLVSRSVMGVIGVAVEAYIARRLIGVTMTTQLVSSWRAVLATLTMAASVWAVDLVSSGDGILQLALKILIGAGSYFAMTAALWWAAGRPAGPEREALDMLLMVRRRALHQ